MAAIEDTEEPAWVKRFLTALATGQGVAAACRAAGVTTSTPYHRRASHPAFRQAWDAIQKVDGRKARHTGPRRPRGAARTDRFIAELAETSNVSAAAAVAGVSLSAIYKLRREDPDFARRWFAALAEGYDNLEMELLGRLRGGSNGGDGDATAQGKFDTAAALRCLAAHRESVAREKGRRTLAAETATIASINAKIDRLRLATEAGEVAIAQARRENAARRTKTREGERDAG